MLRGNCCDHRWQIVEGLLGKAGKGRRVGSCGGSWQGWQWDLAGGGGGEGHFATGGHNSYCAATVVTTDRQLFNGSARDRQ